MRRFPDDWIGGHSPVSGPRPPGSPFHAQAGPETVAIINEIIAANQAKWLADEALAEAVEDLGLELSPLGRKPR